MDEKSLFADEQQFFNLAEELEKELAEEIPPPPEAPAMTGPEGEASLEEIFREFKKGVEQQLSAEDYETHFNLGIAYKEMGLIDEAIGEFQLASKDASRTVECCSMLGLCFLEKGMPQLAIKWYTRGLEAPDIKEVETVGLLYDLGGVYQSTGEMDLAYKTFLEVYGLNTNYRDIVHRVKELEAVKKNLSTSPILAVAISASKCRSAAECLCRRSTASPSTWRRANASRSSGRAAAARPCLARALVNLPPERASGRAGRFASGPGAVRALRRRPGGLFAGVRSDLSSRSPRPLSIRSPESDPDRRGGAAAPAGRRQAARAAARELLAEVGFPDPDRGLGEYPHRLSGGLRQRAFLAMALAAGPKIVIADEPTTALDATVAAQVMELLERLRRDRGLTLLLITHDLGLVARHADRALVLYAGRVAEESASVELFGQPRHPYTRGLLASAPRVNSGKAASPGARFLAIPGAVPDLPDRLLHACAFAPRCPDRFEPCDSAVPPLYERGGSRVSCFLYSETGGARSE